MAYFGVRHLERIKTQCYQARYEKKPVIYVYMGVLCLQPGYLLYKLFKITIAGRDPDEQEDADETFKLVFYWIVGELLNREQC